jgi:O-antigen/teichoic acid export membrane protein
MLRRRLGWVAGGGLLLLLPLRSAVERLFFADSVWLEVVTLGAAAGALWLLLSAQAIFWQAARRFGTFTLTQNLPGVAMLTGGVVFHAADALNAAGAILIYLSSGVLTLALSEWMLRKRMKGTGTARVSSEPGGFWSSAVWMTLFSGSLLAAHETGTFFMAAHHTGSEVALYGAALRGYGLTLILLSSIQRVLLPVTTASVARGDDLSGFRQRVLLWGLSASGVILMMAVLARPLLVWAGRDAYADAAPALQILCVGAVSSYLFGPYGNILLAHRRFSFMARVALVLLALNLSLCVLLVPSLGPAGAALGTSIALTATNVWVFLAARRWMGSGRSEPAKEPREVLAGEAVDRS